MDSDTEIHKKTDTEEPSAASRADPEAEKSTSTADDSSTTAKKEVAKFDADEYDDYYEGYEEPKTAGEKVAYWGNIAMRWTLLMAGLGCLYLTIKEVFPGRLSPNNLFSEAFDVLQVCDDIIEITGSPMKAYGRDVGRNEGRRNHVDSYSYSERDGSERMRVRFNVEG